MKRCLFVLCWILLCTSLFPNSDEDEFEDVDLTEAAKEAANTYQELLQQGITYEENEEYVYALGVYYDACRDYPFKCTEAKRRFKELSETIKSGKPGLKEYDDFEFYDAWISLLKNAEKYGTENPPYYVKCEDIKKGEIDYENRTADYYIDFKYGLTNKFYEIYQNTIIKGLEAAYRNDFKAIPSDWPEHSVYQASFGGEYMIDGTAIAKCGKYKDIFCPWYKMMVVVPHWYYGVMAYDVKPINLIFALYNEEQEILAEGSALIERERVYFKNVPANKMKKIESETLYPLIIAEMGYGQASVSKIEDYPKFTRDWFDVMQKKMALPDKIKLVTDEEKEIHVSPLMDDYYLYLTGVYDYFSYPDMTFVDGTYRDGFIEPFCICKKNPDTKLEDLNAEEDLTDSKYRWRELTWREYNYIQDDLKLPEYKNLQRNEIWARTWKPFFIREE